ncbi:hypothetical protein ACFU7Y_33555 [Kitasatospora sp. NPDC057542]|uniref:hypothetical protein n=1 Tax=Streptomycetaceae TaxID=2062 RepID=UPI001CCFED21|nr:hypothetical protein [Streptomyces sp. LS1784]
MLVDVLGAVVEVLGATIGESRTEERKERDAFAEGRVVVFEGCVAGARPYCRPTAEFLHASATALAISPLRETSARARYLPSDLVLVEVRKRREDDPKTIEKHWTVFECRDGEDVVLIGCASGCVRYVRRALQFEGD